MQRKPAGWRIGIESNYIFISEDDTILLNMLPLYARGVT